MKAAVFSNERESPSSFVQIQEVPIPKVTPGYILLRVVACGVCRTDLHIVEGDLPPLMNHLIPGHQIVGEVVDGATAELPMGSRVGVSWMGGVDGDCWFCHHNMENLCDKPTFTGYSVNGGYAEYVRARQDFTFPLPPGLDDVHVAPLLCAGIIGFRSLRVAGVEPGERVVAWYTWLFVHAWYLIGFKKRLFALLQGAWSYLTFRQGVEVFTTARPGEREEHSATESSGTLRARFYQKSQSTALRPIDPRIPGQEHVNCSLH
jgi:hypothetical protein